MHISKEIPAKKYTRNINKKILNTGIFKNLNPVIHSDDKKSISNSPYKTLPDTNENAFFQRSQYSFNKMSPFIELAKISYQQNKFYRLYHNKDKNAFYSIINTSNKIDNILKQPNSTEEVLTDDEKIKELYNKLEKLCISYLNSYCRITFTREARQRKALVQSILKKCHKFTSYYPTCNLFQQSKLTKVKKMRRFKNQPLDFNSELSKLNYNEQSVNTTNFNTNNTDSFEPSMDWPDSLQLDNEEYTGRIGPISQESSQNSMNDVPSVPALPVSTGLLNTKDPKELSRKNVINKFGRLDENILQQIKSALDNDIELFSLYNYTVEEAEEAGFKMKDILSAYDEEEIVEFYKEDYTGNDYLQRIKSFLKDDIWSFAMHGFKPKHAKEAEFSDEAIFRQYKRDEIVKAYGNGKNLDKETLKQIKSALDDNAESFANHDYTIEEAKIAGFKKKNILSGYFRDKIVKAYGNGEILDKRILKQIKSALDDNILNFIQHGYGLEEAQIAGFSNKDISRYLNTRHIE